MVNLTWESNEDIRAKEIAAQIVLASAEAAWKNRLEVEGLPLFGHDWTRDATLPRLSGELATFEEARCARRVSRNVTCLCRWAVGC